MSTSPAHHGDVRQSRRASRRRTTTRVRYDTAHIRVRRSGRDLLWFVRDLGPAIGFRAPLAPGCAERVLVPTAALWRLMDAAGYRPSEDFRIWAGRLASTAPSSPAQ
ncbi:hypothetical protein PV726_32025 [Streptomyces europaeiscabiei]|uniref:hypothetical protein n=1 Tax=Streptomyces europaeiscabiei TaxID=146819 RepID=UPI0029A62364|nr:hypothetical protein [Streptomyces europaeiscabiei]MDX3694884.1 hypothetical protein [Streptomyces europaeiscabiei]